MKNLITLISLISLASLLVLFPGPTWALEATNSAVPSATQTIGKKAQDLLNEVATKVAQLSLKMQKSYHGTIKSLGSTSFVISTLDKDRVVITNDATGFFRLRGGIRSEINFSALKIGDDVAVVGIIDPVSSDLTARQVIAKIQRINIVGKVQAINKTVYTIAQSDGSTIRIDLSDTLLKKIDPNGKIVTAKIADFQTGSTVFAIAVSPDPTSGIYSILKALVLTK